MLSYHLNLIFSTFCPLHFYPSKYSFKNGPFVVVAYFDIFIAAFLDILYWKIDSECLLLNISRNYLACSFLIYCIAAWTSQDLPTSPNRKRNSG